MSIRQDDQQEKNSFQIVRAICSLSEIMKTMQLVACWTHEKKREIRVQFVQFSLLMKTINSNDDYKDLFWRNRRESAQF